ncbi:MAG TPA: hypothetical protein VF899_14135 [Pyrinomonadaceae bacterium]
MDDKINAQTLGKRAIVDSLDREFARLHFNSCAIVERTPADVLYRLPAQTEASFLSQGLNPASSVGESILRSAAAIEQTFGGITASLWDDPFEWTLPEYLLTPARVIEHLADVEAIRRRAFSSFEDDACLLKHIVMPSGESQPLNDLLQETLRRATAHQAYALALLKTLSRISPPGFII